MKNLLFYFYLACFALLVVLGATQLVFGQEFIVYALLLQLIWGPISALQCLYKVAAERTNKHVGNLYKISFGLTIAYFLGLFVILNIWANTTFFEGRIVSIIGIGVIPWLMLAYFTFILYMEKNLPEEAPLRIEDDLITENI